MYPGNYQLLRGDRFLIIPWWGYNSYVGVWQAGKVVNVSSVQRQSWGEWDLGRRDRRTTTTSPAAQTMYNRHHTTDLNLLQAIYEYLFKSKPSKGRVRHQFSSVTMWTNSVVGTESQMRRATSCHCQSLERKACWICLHSAEFWIFLHSAVTCDLSEILSHWMHNCIVCIYWFSF